jgi:hypothetical protein
MEASFDVEYSGKILGSYQGRIRKPITHISTGWLARNLADGDVILQRVKQWLCTMRKWGRPSVGNKRDGHRFDEYILGALRQKKPPHGMREGAERQLFFALSGLRFQLVCVKAR